MALRNEREQGKESRCTPRPPKVTPCYKCLASITPRFVPPPNVTPKNGGKYTVGTWIPIVSEAEARAHADDFRVLPWHFMEEIQTRESDFLARGGKLIAPESTHNHRRRMAPTGLSKYTGATLA